MLSTCMTSDGLARGAAGACLWERCYVRTYIPTYLHTYLHTYSTSDDDTKTNEQTSIHNLHTRAPLLPGRSAIITRLSYVARIRPG